MPKQMEPEMKPLHYNVCMEDGHEVHDTVVPAVHLCGFRTCVTVRHVPGLSRCKIEAIVDGNSSPVRAVT